MPIDDPAHPAHPAAATLAQAAPRPLAGVGWMLVTGLLFVGVTAIVKALGSEVPAAQAAFLRYATGLVFLLPMLGAVRAAHLTGWQVRLFAWRGAAHAAGVALWFHAMTRIPLAEVTAMNYLSPVYVTLGAALVLGERLSGTRVLAVLGGLAGAAIILRPGFREVSDGHVAMLIAALLFSASYIIAKRLSGEVSAMVVVAMLSAVVTVGLAPLAWAVWEPVTWAQVGALFVVAALATAGHWTMTKAFAAAPVGVTQPVAFLQLVWAALLGAAVFGEPLDPWVALGGAVIVGSVTLVAWREGRGRRPAPSARPRGV